MQTTKKIQFTQSFYHQISASEVINSYLENDKLTNCKVLSMVASGGNPNNNIITVLFEYEDIYEGQTDDK